jgi:hypothetical protein
VVSIGLPHNGNDLYNQEAPLKNLLVVTAAVAALVLAGCSSCNPPNAAPPRAAAPSPCDPPPALAAAEQPSLCGDLPAEALPGQTWCCEALPQAAPPPQRVCTCAEQVRRTPVPAEYETVTEQIEVAPARTEWQKVACASGRGECWQLVNIPAQFETRSRQRLVREAYEKLEYIPAQFENVVSAPPSPIYKWVRHQDCDGGSAAARPLSVPAPVGK